ncbi:MAG: hypothetical protein ACXWBL_02890 [Usitatibacter sp.]
MFPLVAVTAVLAVRGAFGRSVFSRGRFDWQMFLLGAGFMLLETRAVTELSLLFGSTWVVNTSVFAGVRHDPAGGLAEMQTPNLLSIARVPPPWLPMKRAGVPLCEFSPNRNRARRLACRISRDSSEGSL